MRSSWVLRVIAVGSLLLLLWGCSLPHLNIYQDPLTPEEHFKLGMAYENEGRLKEAAREYGTASAEVPESYYYLGNIHFQQKEYDDAEKNYKRAIKRMPRDPRSYNNLAWLYYVQNKNLEQAETLALRALELVSEEESGAYRDTLDKIRSAKPQN